MTDLEVGDEANLNESESRLLAKQNNLDYEGTDEKIAFLENSKLYDPSPLIRDAFMDL